MKKKKKGTRRAETAGGARLQIETILDFGEEASRSSGSARARRS